MSKQIENDNDNSDVTRRLVAPCGDLDEKNQDVSIDVSGLISRLLFFDTYIIDSTRLLEIPHLVSLFGYDGFLELLDAGAVEIDSVFRSLSVCDNRPPDAPSTHPGFHWVPLVGFAEATETANENLVNALSRLNLVKRDRDRLGNAVREVLHVATTPSAGKAVAEQLRYDLLRASDEVRQAIVAAVRRRFGIETGIHDFAIGFAEEDGGYRHTTDLEKAFNLNIHQVHDVIDDAIVAVGDLESRIEQMADLSAISGFVEADLPLFTGKWSFLSRALCPEKQEASFHRILEIADVPSVPTGAVDIRVDANRLLKLRESADRREFVEWLSKVPSLTDQEIRDRVAGFRAWMSTLIHGPRGKAFRFLLTTGLGSIPFVGPVLGASLGALDTFFLDKVVPRSGIACFVNQGYPSLFR